MLAIIIVAQIATCRALSNVLRDGPTLALPNNLNNCKMFPNAVHCSAKLCTNVVYELYKSSDNLITVCLR